MASTIQLQRTINLAQQFIRNAPLIFTALVNATVDAAGTGYVKGDIVGINGGTATALVTSVNGGGGVLGLSVLSGGVGYTTAATGVGTTGGSGSLLSVNTFVSNNDPAFSNADWVMQTILAPPGAFRWNRTSATPQVPTFSTVAGVTDYSVSLSNFGWIERAAAYDPANAFSGYELQIGLVLGSETLQNQPARIAAELDNDDGSITFRIFPSPDRVYNIVVDWQASAPQFSSLTQTWSPIPDYLSYIYNEGFQAKSYEYFGDPRWQASMQLFYTSLAAAMEGMDLTQRNVWLSDRLNSLRQTAAVQSGKG